MAQKVLPQREIDIPKGSICSIICFLKTLASVDTGIIKRRAVQALKEICLMMISCFSFETLLPEALNYIYWQEVCFCFCYCLLFINKSCPLMQPIDKILSEASNTQDTLANATCFF